MRDIVLFKAKRLDNGEWVSGGSIIQFVDDGVRSVYIPQFNEKCTCEHDFETDDILGFSDCRFYKVIPETVCKYTGLTDITGNQIWENDIVAFEHTKMIENIYQWGKTTRYTRNYAIEFVNTFNNYGLRFRNKKVHFPCKRSTLMMHNVEVIGNVFDNPELLEKKQNEDH